MQSVSMGFGFNPSLIGKYQLRLKDSFLSLWPLGFNFYNTVGIARPISAWSQSWQQIEIFTHMAYRDAVFGSWGVFGGADSDFLGPECAECVRTGFFPRGNIQTLFLKKLENLMF